MEFQFLKETPQTQDSGLDFGHKEIVSTLQQIVCKEQQNLTIGLFGGWGSGKSSIVESLKRSLKEVKVPLVVFDVWKHEGDALRRTFLTELVGKLDSEYGEEYFKKNYKGDQRMRFALSSSKEMLTVKWQKLGIHLGILLLFGLFLLTMFAVINWLLSLIGLGLIDEMSQERIGLMAGAVLSATLLYKYVDYFIRAEKSEYKEDRFQDPHEFELEFERIIANLDSKTGKIVVAFDNLDRVSGDNALKIIATIKTFLDYQSKDEKNKKTVFFLIPCDVGSMKDHIAFSSTAADKNEAKELYWDEFLRKFFSTSIWIPEFYPTELEKFAVGKLQETKVAEFNNPYLSWLIIKVFHKNPRQIIQFINILLSNFLLLKQFCESGAFHDPNFYKVNVPQLAKFLLIKQRHSGCLEEYALHCVYDLLDPWMLEVIKDEKFKVLLKQTGDIDIPSLEPYFKYRVSKMEQENQAIVHFINSVTTGGDNVDELVEKIDFQTCSEAFASIVRSQLRSINNILIKSALVDQVLELIISNKLDADRGLNKDLTLFFSSPTDLVIFYEIEPIKVMQGLLERAGDLTKIELNSIIEYYLSTLVPNEQLTARFESKQHSQTGRIYTFAANYSGEFSESQLVTIRTSLEEKHGHNSILELFFKNQQVQKTFITQKYINSIFETFSPAKSIQVSLHCLWLMNSFWPREIYLIRIVETILPHFHSIFNEDYAEKSPTLLHKYALAISLLLERILEYDSNKSSDSNLMVLSSNLIDFLRKRTVEELMEYVPLLITLAKFDSSKDRAIAMVNSVLVEGDDTVIKIVLSENPELMKQGFSREIEEQLISAIVKFDSLSFFTDALSLQNIAMLVVKYMEQGKVDVARSLIVQHRDNWGLEIQNFLVNEIVGLFSASNHAYEVSPLFRRFLELIFLVADNDLEILASSGFWDVIGSMVSEKDPLGVQKLAFDTIKEYNDLMTPGEAERLIEKLLTNLSSRAYDDDYVFNEALLYLIENYPSNSFNAQYLGLVFQLTASSVTTNIFVICARAIEKLVYDPDDFMVQIRAFLDRYEQLGDQQLRDAQIVLKALHDRLKNEKSEVFKEVKSRIKKFR